MCPPKLLYVIGSLRLGGAESQLVLLVRELTKRGWCCEVFVLEAVGPLLNELQSLKVVVHGGGLALTAPRWKKLFQLFRASIRLWFVARKYKPNILHAYLPLTNFLGALSGFLTRTRLIVTSRRALGTHQDVAPIWKMLDRVSNRLSHVITANSIAVMKDTIQRDGVEPTKLRIIYNGLHYSKYKEQVGCRRDMRNRLSLADYDIAIVAVGNYIPYKGHADLLNALPEILANGVKARVFLVGEDRGEGEKLVRLAQDLGVAELVSFYGQCANVVQLLGAMDIFVMPSHEEGFSNALLEAMASGLPIVATDVGGNAEALEFGEAGLLVPPHSPVRLAEAINRLLVDRKLSYALSEKARSVIIEKYTAEIMADNYILFYKEFFAGGN